jgi:SAM-dependent methyltransferase
MPKTRPCPVCNTGSEKARLFLEGNIDPSRLTAFSFASRKEPEYMCHRLVQCPTCDLVYVDQPPGEDELAHAYHTANYDSSEEANDAAAAYIKAIRPTISALAHCNSALEIGTGTGIFLEYLSREGFSELVGVEPSSAAIEAAPPNRRAWIHESMFDEHDFTPDSFDLICCFMTMEHVPEPGVIARAALRLLRPGGAFVTVTHDYHSLVNRLLGKRSPIIDIEHMQLFSERSVRYLFEDSGYAGVTTKTFVNSYALSYWMRLAPLPPALKRGISNVVSALGMDHLKLGINVGNHITAGFRRG